MYVFTEKSRKVGGDVVHLLDEVRVEVLLVVGKVHHSGGKVEDADEVELRDLVTHGGLGRLDDLRDSVLRVLAEGLSQLVDRGLLVGRDGLLVADGLDALGVLKVVGDNPDELGEVPAVPLADAHRERVDVLVQLVQEADALDDHVVHAVDVELDLGTAVAVGETELGLVEVAVLEVGDEVAQVEADPTLDLDHKLRLVALDAARLADRRGELVLSNAEDLLGGDVRGEEVLQVVVDETLGDGVDVLEGVLGSLEGDERHKLHHLGELGEVDDRLLLGLDERADVLGASHLKKSIPGCVFEKNVIHCFRALLYI